MEVNGALGQGLACLSGLGHERLLVVGLPPDDLRQRVILVFSFEKLELLTFGATLICDLQFFVLF